MPVAKPPSTAIRPSASCAAVQVGDALTRAEARAIRNWAMALPGIGRALYERRDPLRDELQAGLRLLTYFEGEHEQTADGQPVPWDEPLSPTMAAFARGESNAIDVDQLLPNETMALLEYAKVFTGGDPAQIDAEVNQLADAGERALQAAREAPDNQSDTQGTDMPDASDSAQEPPQSLAGEVRRGAAAMDPQRLRAELAGLSAPQRAAYLQAIFGDGIVEQKPRPESAISPTVTLPPKPAPAAVGTKRTGPVPPSELKRAMAGMSATQRRAYLAEQFGTGYTRRPTPDDSGEPPPPLP
jgi:hypothetical protein